MYGLRSSPKAWQDYFATSMEELGSRRLLSEPNVYANNTNDVYAIVYVDDIRVTGDPSKVNKMFEKIQEKILLKRAGYLDPGESHYFLRRQIHNEGNYFDIKLEDGYIETVLQEVNVAKCSPAPAPGIQQQTNLHVQTQNQSPRTNTRSIENYSGFLLQEADWKKAKQLLRYLRGTSNYTQQLRATTTVNTSEAVLDMDVHVDADWAGCPSTRQSTTGFLIYILGTPVSFGF